MENIIFVNSINSENNFRNISLGSLSLATILKNKGYNVQIVDFNYLYRKNIIKKNMVYDDNIEEMCDYILKLNPDIVDFYTMCNCYHISIMLSEKLKQKDPSLKIIFGGPQASLTAVESMEAFPWIDVIGIGEGENTIEHIVKALYSNNDFSSIPGIAYRKQNKVICNNEINLIKNLDELPYLDYSFIDMEEIQEIPLDVGRGCPFSCTYCSTKTFWKREFRLKSPNRIMKEIKYLIEKFNIKKFNFVHDLFTVNKNIVIEFCDLVLKEKLNIKWKCSARIDTLDEELISKMAQTGCYSIYLGIETGSERMQKIINKNINLSKVCEVIDILKKYNFEITTSFIYGFPDESLEDVGHTLNLIHILTSKKVNYIQLHLMAVLPGTEIFENVKNNLVLSSNFSDICDYYEKSHYFNTLVSNKPKIFPQYFEFETSLKTKLLFLDKFIAHFYPLLYKHYPFTYKLLMEYHSNSLVALFMDFRDTNLDLLNELFIKKQCNISNINKTEYVSILNACINSGCFGENTDLIRALCNFEFNIYNFLYIENESEKTLEYNFDVLKIKEIGLTSNPSVLEPVTIKFARINKKQINVKRVG